MLVLQKKLFESYDPAAFAICALGLSLQSSQDRLERMEPPFLRGDKPCAAALPVLDEE